MIVIHLIDSCQQFILLFHISTNAARSFFSNYRGLAPVALCSFLQTQTGDLVFEDVDGDLDDELGQLSLGTIVSIMLYALNILFYIVLKVFHLYVYQRLTQKQTLVIAPSSFIIIVITIIIITIFIAIVVFIIIINISVITIAVFVVITIIVIDIIVTIVTFFLNW